MSNIDKSLKMFLFALAKKLQPDGKPIVFSEEEYQRAASEREDFYMLARPGAPDGSGVELWITEASQEKRNAWRQERREECAAYAEDVENMRDDKLREEARQDSATL